MKSIEFQKFINLVTFDKDLITIERDIVKNRKKIENVLSDLSRENDEFDDTRSLKIESKKAVDEKELYMKVLDDKESQLKQKIDSISNQKEYKALQREHDQLKEDRLAQEQILLQLWNKFEVIDKSYASKQLAHTEKVKELEEEIASIQASTKKLTSDLKALEKQREEKQEDVPEEWLDIYVNMKGRVEDPVAPVISESCNACFYMVTASDMQRLKRNELLQCRECYRLLYLDGVATESKVE